jgi:hypothetical protein
MKQINYAKKYEEYEWPTIALGDERVVNPINATLIVINTIYGLFRTEAIMDGPYI